MKLDFSTVLTNLEGHAIQETKVDKFGQPITEAAVDETNQPILVMDDRGKPRPLHRVVMIDVTARALAVRCLTADSISGRTISGEERIKRATLALRVLQAKEPIDLESQDQAQLKELAGDLGFGTVVVYAFYQFIEGKPQVAA